MNKDGVFLDICLLDNHLLKLIKKCNETSVRAKSRNEWNGRIDHYRPTNPIQGELQYEYCNITSWTEVQELIYSDQTLQVARANLGVERHIHNTTIWWSFFH